MSMRLAVQDSKERTWTHDGVHLSTNL